MDVIVTHTNGDFDGLASLVAAKKLYPKAKIVLPGSQERSVREFLNMVKSIVKVEAEKDTDFKNIDRLIIVDTRVKNRIGKVAEFLNRHNLKIHIYDHHPRRDGDLTGVKDVYEPCGATVTIILENIKRRKIPITPFEATIFALGIYEDTGSLTYQTTTKKDIDMVGFLFSKGANLSMISAYLNRELTDPEMQILAAMIKATKIYIIGDVHIGVAWVVCDNSSVDLAWLTHKLLEIENVNVIFTLFETGKRIQLITRSRLSRVDVGKIAKYFGGGGHSSAASATIKGGDLEKVKDELLCILRKNLKSKIFAEDIMSFPVKTLTSITKVKEAKQTMEKLKVEGMPVVDQGKLVGMITRSELINALRNGFGHAPLKAYMKRKVIWAKKRTPVNELRKMITEKNIGLIPVLWRGKIAGIISRTGFFKRTHEQILAAAPRVLKKVVKKAPKIKRLNKKIKSALPKKTYALLREIGRTADECEIRAYLVGGFVRDLIIGQPNFDLDIVVEANGLEYAKQLAEKLAASLKLHHRFQTATLSLASGLKIDIATARTEFYEYPAALPVVNQSSLKQDLYRRDFTINTLAISLNQKNFGKLIDFFSAQRDLKAKKIRVLHDLSFVEDPTRILRAVRFEQRFNFSIDKHTENLIKAAVDLEMFDRLHKFRISDELVLLLNEPHPLKVVRRMGQLHELKFIHKKIIFNKKMVDLLESAEEVLGWYKISFLDQTLERWIVYLLVLLDGLSGRDTKEIFNRFCFKKKAQSCLLLVKAKSGKIMKALSRTKNIRPSNAYNILSALPLELLLFLMAKTKDIKIKEIFIQFLTKYANIKTTLTGHDLKELDFKPGPHFKKVLQKILFAKIDGQVSSKNEELKLAKRLLCLSGH